jgi:hypothetical protein
MAKVVFGNHSSVIVPQRDRDSIRRFYCDVLGGVITKEELAFAHRGFKRADDGFAGATTRWGFYLVSLKRYLEGGQGSPNPVDADL